jgi:hypothetical protein
MIWNVLCISLPPIWVQANIFGTPSLALFSLATIIFSSLDNTSSIFNIRLING